MGIFDLKGGSSSNWNYSDPNKDGYMEQLEGTIVEISNPQSVNFGTKKPEFWPDGNPKRNLCTTIKGRSGKELNFTFAPRSRAAAAFLLALDPTNSRSQVSIEEILGKMVRISTEAGVYNAQNPRPWTVEVLGDGDVQAVRGIKDLSQQQQPQQPPQQEQPQQQPVSPQLQNAMNQAAQAVSQAGQQAGHVTFQQDPAGGYYDSDIPF